ncbi:hypothetical protein CUMW_249360 [Citrus unshiu]|uniref:AAA+ ATPase domain-containing protein n=1 Tax=Citrus unshiu TaxID=55188 RepID=A0A2H5QPG5_CITUN|nr:hypothetical protein CUMW_249360 [Citrus unshiu]
MAAEVGLAAFSSIVSEGAKSLLKPIIRQISYVFKYQSYIDELKDKVKRLEHKRERVEIPVHQATQQGDEIYKDVADWLNSVKEFTQGAAKSITDDEDRAKKFCFKGLCPNLISRYKLSRQAAKAAEAAASLVGKGNFSNVSHRPTPKLVEHMQVKDFEAFDSRMKVFQDVMEAVRDDKLNIIGVYGMGGVGKTTLVKQVAKQMMEDKLFDKVAMAEVTENPDHQKIQDELASDLGIKFELNESIFDRANRLCGVFKNEERHLIILDNIWRELEFDKVGIPSRDVEKERMDDQRRCTIILTCRRQDLLRNVMNSQKEIQIDALSKEEALHLGQLQHLEIRNCWSIEGVVNTTGLGGRDELKVFPKLHYLSLHWLPKLSSFASPEDVGIPTSLVNLNVSRCRKIEEIIGHVREEVKENRIPFSELKLLEEGELYHREGNLNSTIQKCYIEMIGFRDIENIKLSLFPRLKEIWHNQALPVSFFNNLRHLVLDDCKNMSSAIPANLIRCLNNLASLEVRNCDSLEEVLHLEELNADKEHLCPLFPKLFSLRLIDLPKLKRFCNFTGNIIELLELEYLTIENCPDMETFTSNST